MTLTFRPARAQDIPAVVALVQSAYRGDASRQGWTTEADLIEGQRVDADMLTEVLEGDDTVVALALREDRVVGCCELRRLAAEGSAYLGMFAVEPELQGSGLGAAVLAEAERFVRDEWSASRLQMTVIEVRSELIAWYRRRGYEPTGETEPFPYGDDRFGVPLRDDLRFVVLAKSL